MASVRVTSYSILVSLARVWLASSLSKQSSSLYREAERPKLLALNRNSQIHNGALSLIA